VFVNNHVKYEIITVQHLYNEPGICIIQLFPWQI